MVRDIYGNSIAVLTFEEPSRKLKIMGEAEIFLPPRQPGRCFIDPDPRMFPFQYPPEEQIELIQYKLPSYPLEGPTL